MALQLETAKISPDLTVVRVSGHLTFEGTDAVPSLIVALLDRGVNKFILHLGGVQQIDSLGGVALIRCFFAAREAKAAMCVACASPAVTQLFTITPVNGVIPFFPTIPAAYEHFNQPPNRGAETA